MESMGKHVHRLTEKQVEIQTGVCSECGPVSIVSTDGVWRCRSGRKAGRQKNKVHRDYVDASPSGACDLCGVIGSLVADHDHSCCPGKTSCGACLRGRLCRNCNIGLGHFRDDPALLLKAVDYLSSCTL